ncbi:MAG: TIGR01212 family radical SAM protein [Deferrisomatales bacterium]|nr:TIGR01212 family radical SAM protein [Deferrisomatales bacterium]
MPWSPCSPEPYPGIGAHWRARFGQPVRRVGLDPGFPCPHRDPRTGTGCAFCDPASFTAPSAATGPGRPVAEQLATGIAGLRRQGVNRFAAYFQPRTNTNASSGKLVAAWDVATRPPEVVALCVGTRPDCVPDPVLDLLAEYTGGREVWLELGLQSARNATLRALHRGHDAGQFADACRRARQRGLLVCAHVILGLPGEDAADEAHTAAFLAASGVEGVKLHQLAVVRGTPLEVRWRAGGLAVLDEAEYVDRTVAFCRQLSSATVLHRLVGDPAQERLLAPHFNKGRVVAAIRRRLRSATGNENAGPRAGVS